MNKIAFMILIVLGTSAQLMAQIPNGGFESWGGRRPREDFRLPYV
jgi:hypothetical protein